MGFREIERVTGISHNTIINWVRQAELAADDAQVNEHSASTSPEQKQVSDCSDRPPALDSAAFAWEQLPVENGAMTQPGSHVTYCAAHHTLHPSIRERDQFHLIR